MRPRKKFHIIVPLLVLFAVGAAILYIRVIEFTVSTRTLLVEEMGRAVNKKAFAQSVRFDLIKGLVLDGVVIYDDKHAIVRAKEISCGLLIPSLGAKKVIVPSIKIESPRIYVERRADGSLNLFDLIPKEYVSKSGMAVSVHKIVVKRGRVDFTDLSLDPPLRMKFVNVDAQTSLYLPIRVLFRSSFGVPSGTAMSVSGEYVVPTDTLTVDIATSNFAPKDFDRYYRASGFSFPSGELALRAALKARGGFIEADINAATKSITVLKDKITAKADCAIKARAQYVMQDKKLTYGGTIDIRAMDMEGVELVGKLENVKARVDFDQTRLAATDAKAVALGMAWDAKVNIVNFQNPIIDVYAHSAVHLSAFQEMLAARFGVRLPTEIAGKGDLRISMEITPQAIKSNGYLSVSDATARLGSGNFPIEHVTGEIRFTPEELTWQGLRSSYRGVEYTSSGKLIDLNAPRVSLDVTSRDLIYTAAFAIKDDVIRLSKLDGRYFRSKFSAAGDLSLADPETVDAELKGKLSLDLADLRKISQNSAGIRKMKASGKVNAEFELIGDLKDLTECYVNAKMKAGQMSVYGLKFTGATLNFVQEQGVGSIKSMRSSFYGGTISVTARIDWFAKGLPYSANLDAIGVKLEDVKADTDFKDKDVSGDIKVYADVKGIFKDASRLTAIGHVRLNKGRLWQLDLFKGAGTLIFSKDFSDIVFTSGACDYKVRDNVCFIDNLVMKSDLLTLTGSGRIGFDRSVEGALRPEISEDIAESGTLASAVGKGTIIEIGGTLKDPSFKTKTNMMSVVGAMLRQE